MRIKFLKNDYYYYFLRTCGSKVGKKFEFTGKIILLEKCVIKDKFEKKKRFLKYETQMGTLCGG